MAELQDWSMNANLNNFATADGGMPENMARSLVNDTVREQMAQIRRWYDAPDWLDLTQGAVIQRVSATQIRVVAFDATPYATAGRRIKVQTAGLPPTQVTEAFILSSAPSGADTLIDFATTVTIPSGIDELFFFISGEFGELAYTDSLGTIDFFVPATEDSTGIQQAIDDAFTAGGGVVLMKGESYDITSALEIKTKVTLWGRGPAATVLIVNVASPPNVDYVIGTEGANWWHLKDFAIEGSASSQTAGAGHGIYAKSLNSGVSNCSIDNVYVSNSYGTGIYLESSLFALTTIAISNVGVATPNADGIHLDDAGDHLNAISIVNTHVAGPGQDPLVLDYAGFRLGGNFTLTNVHVYSIDKGGAQNGRGFVMKPTGITGTLGADRSTLTGFQVYGTGASARGVEIQGRNCVVSDGVVDLTGSAATGVYLLNPNAGLGISADFNVVRGISTKNVDNGVTIEGNVKDTLVQGCQFDDVTIGISNAGDNNTLIDNNIKTTVLAGTSGIIVTQTADRTSVSGNTIREAATGLEIEDGATRTRVGPNVFIDCTTPILDSANTGVVSNVSVQNPQTELTLVKGTGQVGVSPAELADIEYPHYLPNGFRSYRLSGGVWIADRQNMTLNISSGPLGTSSDPVIGTAVAAGAAASPGANVTALWIRDVFYTPAIGESVTLWWAGSSNPLAYSSLLSLEFRERLNLEYGAISFPGTYLLVEYVEE